MGRKKKAAGASGEAVGKPGEALPTVSPAVSGKPLVDVLDEPATGTPGESPDRDFLAEAFAAAAIAKPEGGVVAAAAPGAPLPDMPGLPFLRLEWREPAELDDNPANWKTHGGGQIDAQAAQMEAVGWAGAALYNETTGRLLDGHMRKRIAASRGEKIPVLIGRWSPEQEALILATLDPIGQMADANNVKLAGLLEQVGEQSAGLVPLLEDLAAKAGAAAEPYAPNLAPETSFDPVTEQDVSRKAEELSGKFSQAGKQRLISVTCPHCAEDFQIDPAGFKAELEADARSAAKPE